MLEVELAFVDGVDAVTSQLGKMYQEIINSELSVREIETSIRTKKNSGTSGRKAISFDRKTKSEIISFYDSDVSISSNQNGAGKLSFKFESKEDLDRLVKLLLNK